MTNEIRNIDPAETIKSLSRGFILVVDDEEQNRSLLRDPLEAKGYEIDEAQNGLEALQKIAARQPDVILLDLMMPKMDGFEVCRRLRKDVKTAHIPVLMVTALSERKERLMGIESGANDFLNKPVDIQDVILRVGNAVYSKHLHDELHAEQIKSEALLLNILPASIAERMKQGEVAITDSHSDVTVLIANLIGFTSLLAHVDPSQIVQLLNEVFSAFDDLVEKYELQKLKTVGDSYIVVGGVSTPRANHREAMIELAIEFQREIGRLNQQYDMSLRLRIGISSGPLVAGVIGRKKFAYDIWGETVNLAWRLESSAEPGTIQISESTFEAVRDKYNFEMKQNSFDGHTGDPAYLVGKKIGLPSALETIKTVAA